jgi:hypothetical protein
MHVGLCIGTWSQPISTTTVTEGQFPRVGGRKHYFSPFASPNRTRNLSPIGLAHILKVFFSSFLPFSVYVFFQILFVRFTFIFLICSNFKNYSFLKVFQSF